MLQLKPTTLPPNKAKAIRKALSSGELGDLVEYLTLKEAEITAESANALIDSLDSDGSKPESDEKAKEALFYRKVIELLSDLSNPDYKFDYQEVEPMPTSKLNQLKNYGV